MRAWLRRRYWRLRWLSASRHLDEHIRYVEYVANNPEAVDW